MDMNNQFLPMHNNDLIIEGACMLWRQRKEKS